MNKLHAVRCALGLQSRRRKQERPIVPDVGHSGRPAHTRNLCGGRRFNIGDACLLRRDLPHLPVLPYKNPTSHLDTVLIETFPSSADHPLIVEVGYSVHVPRVGRPEETGDHVVRRGSGGNPRCGKEKRQEDGTEYQGFHVVVRMGE